MHFDVTAAVHEQKERRLQIAQEQLQASETHMQQLVQKRLSDIEMLESVIMENYDLSQATTVWIRELILYKQKIPLALVQLREKLQSEMRQAMRTKAEFLGDNPQARLLDVFANMWNDDDDVTVNH